VDHVHAGSLLLTNQVRNVLTPLKTFVFDSEEAFGEMGEATWKITEAARIKMRMS
jgi:hypothetical protein